MDFFEKNLSQLAADDIDWLVKSEVQEGQDIEFKRDLPTENGQKDRWYSKGDKIGDYAKTIIVREIVAFANAQGGSLVLGIEESTDKPSRAAKLAPIPNAIELADRLKRACRDSIEPIVSGIEIIGIPMTAEGAGVVVMRVPNGSPFAPHRSKKDKECYLRRNDETTPMTMVEIHRHVIEASNRYERLEERFAARRAQLQAQHDVHSSAMVGWVFAVAAFPVVPLAVPAVHRVRAARPAMRPIVVGGFSNGRKYSAEMWGGSENWRPMLQGSQCSLQHSERASTALRIWNDGAIVFEWKHMRLDANERYLALEWFPGVFGNALLAIERMRMAAKLPSIEYSIELTLLVLGQQQSLLRYGGGDFARAYAEFVPGAYRYGPYPVNSANHFEDLTRLMETDVLNSVGRDDATPRTFDYEGALLEIAKDFSETQ